MRAGRVGEAFADRERYAPGDTARLLIKSSLETATTALVLLNGLTVAAIVIAVFLLLIQLINQATLW